MTISTTTSEVTYQGNGSNTSFTFPFVGVAAADINVYYTDAGGNNTLLSPSVYTIALNAAPVGGLWGIGGTVTYPNSGSPIASGTYLTIVRAVPFTQTISISNQGNFYPSAVEQAIDLILLELQQTNTQATYSINAPLEDVNPPNALPNAVNRANTYLYFDANGNPTTSTVTPITPAPIAIATPRVISTTGTHTLNINITDSNNGVTVYQTSPVSTTLQLPAGSGPYPVFDASGNANTYNITVLPPAGLKIKNATSYVMNTAYASAIFYNDGTSIVVR